MRTLALFIVLFCHSHYVNTEAVRTAGTANVMLSRLLREPEYVLAFGTAAVYVSFSVTDAVALKPEERGYLLPKAQKIVVFLSSFVEVLGHVSVKRPGNEGKI